MPVKATPKNPTGPIELLYAATAVNIEGAFGTPVADGGEEVLPRFSMVAYTGEPMTVEGWRWPVVVDLDGMSIPSQRRPIRFGHSMHQGVGHSERIAVDGGRLVAEGIVSRDTPAAREVVVSGKRGFPWQVSIGARITQSQLVPSGKFVNVNGRSFQGPLYVGRKSVLGEISFVDLGADGNTSAHIAAQEYSTMTPGTDTDVTNGVDTDETTPPADTATDPKPAGNSTPSKIEAKAPTSESDPAADMRASAAAESRRIAAVRKITADHPDIEAKAIEEGWDATKTELEVLRASRPRASGGGPAVHVPDNTVDGQILEAACMMTAKLSDVEKLHDEKTLEAASRRFRGGIGLQELLLEAAWANGYGGRNFRDSRAVLRYAFAATGATNLQAGFSTVDIGGILSNVSNKFLLEGFFSVERTWRNICSVRNVSDFKTVTSYRLIGKDQYEKVAPGGELKHGTLGEESYSNKADTYGLLLSIDRRDVINDDLGAITTVPRKLGRGSGLKINDVFWTIFLGNSGGAFFAVENKNVITGADTALSIDGLTKGEIAFMDQTDAEGKPIGIMPAILLVPTALSAVGTTLWKSLEIRDTTASTKYPVANPHVGKFRAEVSRYLGNAQYPGSSAKAWYLLAEPTDLSVIEVAFLNGQESPTIETAEADFNVLGIQMRGYHDFGVALQEPRGGIKATGEA